MQAVGDRLTRLRRRLPARRAKSLDAAATARSRWWLHRGKSRPGSVPLRMKYLLPLLLLTAANACGQMETLDLGPHGRLTLYLLGEWRSNTTRNTEQITLTIQPRSEAVNAMCTLVVTFPSTDRFDTKARLKLRVEADAYGLAEQSVERKAYAREFALTTGYGFYCSFTDPALRGKPMEKGNYKVMSVGKIRLTPQVLVDVQIMGEGFSDEAYNQLLGAIEGMEYTPSR